MAPPAGRRLVMVTGMSGAGKTLVLKALEDIGFEAVDNLPLSILPDLLRATGFGTGDPAPATSPSPLAVGVDIRTRDFAADPACRALAAVRGQDGVNLSLLFVDCDDDVLQRRYMETRRRHPLAADRPVADGIAQERQALDRLREQADLVMDTTNLTPGDLRHRVARQFRPEVGAEPMIFVTSFSYRRGLPRDADLVFDVRFLRNPHYDPDLRELTGLDPAVARHIQGDPGLADFLTNLQHLLAPLLPRFAREGKAYLTLAVGCTGGRHRSVFVSEHLAAWLRGLGRRVEVRHRELDAGEVLGEMDARVVWHLPGGTA